MESTFKLISIKVLKIGLFFLLMSKNIICLASENNRDNLPAAALIPKRILNLTTEEEQWIEAHKSINILAHGNLAPLEFFDESGEYKGITANIINRLAGDIGLNFHVINSAKSVSPERLDAIANLSNANELKEDDFSVLNQPYLIVPYSIFSKLNKNGVSKLSDLEGKKVSVLKTESIVHVIEKNYPKIILVKVLKLSEALDSLSKGATEAFIGNQITTNYYINNEGLNNTLKSNETLYKSYIYMAVNRDLPILRSILTKDLATFTQNEKKEILKNWTNTDNRTDMFLYFALDSLLTIAVSYLFVLLWKWRLRRPKLIEEQLGLLNICIQHLNDIVLITDANVSDQRIIFVNDAFEHRTGYSRAEVIGKNAKILQGPKTCRFQLDVIKNALMNFEPVNVELINYTKSGEEYWLDLEIIPVKNHEGLVTHWISVERDISEHKEIELKLLNSKAMAEAANIARGDFLANMSHEIRTPMNGIIGMADLLLDTPLNVNQLEYATIVKDSSYALLAIINDILDLSKIDAGKLEVESIEFTLIDVVENCIDTVFSKANEKNLNLIGFVDPIIPERLIGDPTRVRQILLNLLSNAIKFTSNGDVSLVVKPVQSHDGNNQILFIVKDTGIGITESVATRLFQPFTQADKSVARKYGGTGLGLSITKDLVNLMKGEIRFESKLGFGTSFSVTLPLQISINNEKEIYPKYLNRLRLLVVDPHEIHGEILKKYIESWEIFGLHIVDVDDLFAPLLADNYFDLIIVSSRLNHESQSKICKIIYENKIDIKSIFLTEKNKINHLSSLINLITIQEPLKQSVLLTSLVSLFDRRQINIEINIEKRAQVENLHLSTAYIDEHLILIVDDNKVNQKVAEALLKKVGLSVLFANNGVEAIEYLQKQNFSLILMDCQMPVMDGYEATRVIRQSETFTGLHVPIIAMTANAMVGDKDRCISVGMDDYLSKPIDPVKLKVILNYWLSQEFSEKSLLAKLKQNIEVIDISKLEEMFRDDDATIKELLEAFTLNTPSLLDALKIAVIDVDLEKIKSIGHQLTGSASSFGLLEFCHYSREIERAAIKKELEKTIILYEHILQSYGRICNFIKIRYEDKVLD